MTILPFESESALGALGFFLRKFSIRVVYACTKVHSQFEKVLFRFLGHVNNIYLLTFVPPFLQGGQSGVYDSSPIIASQQPYKVG